MKITYKIHNRSADQKDKIVTTNKHEIVREVLSGYYGHITEDSKLPRYIPALDITLLDIEPEYN